MAITLDGSGTITGITAGGLPDGSVTSDDIAAAAVTDAKLASTLDLSGKTVTLPAGTGGKVLQVLSATKTDTFSTTSTSFVDVPDLSITITPAASTSKLLVMADVKLGNSNYVGYFRIERDGSPTFQPDAAGSRPLVHGVGTYGNGGTQYELASAAVHFLETAGSTNTTTFNVAIRNYVSSHTLYINRTHVDRNLADYEPRTISNITVMEISA